VTLVEIGGSRFKGGLRRLKASARLALTALQQQNAIEISLGLRVLGLEIHSLDFLPLDWAQPLPDAQLRKGFRHVAAQPRRLPKTG